MIQWGPVKVSLNCQDKCDPLRRNETCPPDLTFIDMYMYTRLTSNSRAFQWYKCYISVAYSIPELSSDEENHHFAARFVFEFRTSEKINIKLGPHTEQARELSFDVQLMNN